MRVNFSDDAWQAEADLINQLRGYTVRLLYREDGVEFNHDATVRGWCRDGRGLRFSFTVWDDEKEESTHEFFTVRSVDIIDLWIY